MTKAIARYAFWASFLIAPAVGAGAEPYGIVGLGGGYSVPERLSASFDMIGGFDGENSRGFHNPLLSLHAAAGPGGGRLGLGFGFFGVSGDASFLGGAMLRATAIRTWGSPVTLAADKTAFGGEVELWFWGVGATVGVVDAGRSGGGATILWGVRVAIPVGYFPRFPREY
jgi:hypothetical protein